MYKVLIYVLTRKQEQQTMNTRQTTVLEHLE